MPTVPGGLAPRRDRHPVVQLQALEALADRPLAVVAVPREVRDELRASFSAEVRQAAGRLFPPGR